MSRPPNPLANFRSYSYYHVLAICESSQAADDLAKDTEPKKWLHPSAPNSNLGQADTFGLLGPFAVKYVDETNKTGRYCILINGATDAMFTIVRAKWAAATAADVTFMDQATSIAIEGELNISEPKGVVFLDILVACCLALGIDAANVVFVLKTFFVGEPDEPNDPSYITDIEPLRFIAYDITGTFAETGGLYQMSFVALVHGASRLPQYGKAASGLNLSAGATLDATFKNLSNHVQENYNELFKCTEDTLAQSAPEIGKLLTKVTYKFDLDESYKGNEYHVTDTPQQVKDKEGCDSQSKINIPANMSLEDAIHLIMKKCPQVIEDMANGVMVNGRKIHYEYKIHSGISSARGPAKGNTQGQIEYTVVYRVERFMRPRDVSLFDIVGKVSTRDLTALSDDEVAKLNEDEQRLRNNLISFDYIYTGKNIDILEFEMKMNLGMAYLQIASTNNTLKEQLQAVPTAVTHIPSVDIDRGTGSRFGELTQIPVYFGTLIRAPSTRNTQESSKKAEAAYSLSKHASLEVQDVTMKIYGNPLLVGTTNRTTSPKNIGKKQPPATEPSATRKGNWRDWGLFPSFAKINIKMPRNNDDISLFLGESATRDADVARGNYDFTRDFWFTGFYYVVGIEHIFDGGEFTQELSLIGIPESSAVKAVGRGKTGAMNQATVDIQTAVLSCYDSRVDPCAKNKEELQVPSSGARVARNQECLQGPDAKKTPPIVCTQDITLPPGTDLTLEANTVAANEANSNLVQTPPGTVGG